MNAKSISYYPSFELYQVLRNQLITMLTDEDLVYHPEDSSITLGGLCQQIGEIEYAYLQSFATLTIDFSYRVNAPELERSVAALAAWYEQLDIEMQAAIEHLSDEQIAARLTDRGEGERMPLRLQLEIYKETLLIYFGKVSSYLKALGKELPDEWRERIAYIDELYVRSV
jgi:hypothetical protein